MDLNPFDLRGPQFLLFYVLLLAVTVLVVWLLRRSRESGQAGKEIANARVIAEDPYRVAFLRGGRYEVVQVALVSLIEHGLLRANGEYLLAAIDKAVEKVRHPLEKAILTKFAGRTLGNQGKKAERVYSDGAILAEADHIGEELQLRDLLPTEAVKESRKTRILAAVAFLWIVAGIKIVVALSRGRANIGFLILLAIFAPLLLAGVSKRFRTTLGDKTYKWVRAFFSNLRSRRESLALNSTNSELTFLAAVFGLAALPAAVGGIIKSLQLKPPKPVGSGWGSCGSSCASFSSCGGASSCGGGGGCGGGGCGGGCGGCGG